MIYVIVGLSILFIGIGFLVTIENSRYLLAGYNTMSEEERRKVDIRSYIPFFRKFHIGLGLSFLVLGSLITWVSPNAGGVFMAVYPMIAYIWFVWKSKDYNRGKSSKMNKVGVVVLSGALLLVVALLGFGFRESDLIIGERAIKISGIYGETLHTDEIESIEMVEELPEITFKTNGFALGHIRKGYFQTKEGKVVKLMLNSSEKPFILIREKSGDRIYFSSGEEGENRALFNELREKWPSLLP